MNIKHLNKIKAVIPVAGAGTRLKPHTYTLPKALLNVAGKPILGHILDQVKMLGIKDVVLIVGYLGDKIIEYVHKNYDFTVKYVEQKERKGLGHAINLAAPYVENTDVLIIYGDTIFSGDIRVGFKTPYDGAIGVKPVEDPRRFGVIELEGDRIIRLIEKPEQPPSNLSIVGVNYLKNSALLFECLQQIVDKDIKTKGEYQLTDAFQLMVERGAYLTTFPVEDWFDCGKPETLLATNRHLLLNGHSHVRVIDGTIIKPPVYIADSATVENSIIGPYVTIADASIIRNSIIKDSIINENSIIEDAMLDLSIIGDNAKVEGNYKKLNVGDSSEVAFE